MPVKKNDPTSFQRGFLVLMILLLLVVIIIFANPFLIDLLISGILVTAIYPVHKRIRKGFKNNRTLSAFVSMLLTVIIILIPFTLFAFFIGQEAADAYTVVSDHISEISQQSDAAGTGFNLMDYLPYSQQIEEIFGYLPVSFEDLLTTFQESLGQISTFLIGQTTNILRSLSLLIIHFIVFLMALFYFLKDGDRLVAFIKSLLPLSKQHRQELFEKLGQLSYGIIYGIFGAAVLQGFLIGLGFYFAGFNNPAFWGVVGAIFSPVPYVGTMPVWVPAAIILFINGQWLAGILFSAWSLFVVGTADNILKPYLIGSSSALNPMALLVVLLGGAFTFGLKGLILAPFLLTLTLAFLHIYQLEYKHVLDVKEKAIPEGEAPATLKKWINRLKRK